MTLFFFNILFSPNNQNVVGPLLYVFCLYLFLLNIIIIEKKKKSMSWLKPMEMIITNCFVFGLAKEKVLSFFWDHALSFSCFQTKHFPIKIWIWAEFQFGLVEWRCALIQWPCFATTDTTHHLIRFLDNRPLIKWF